MTSAEFPQFVLMTYDTSSKSRQMKQAGSLYVLSRRRMLLRDITVSQVEGLEAEEIGVLTIDLELSARNEGVPRQGIAETVGCQ